MPTLREKFNKFLKDPKQTYHGTGSNNIHLNLLTLYEMMQMYGENAEYDRMTYSNKCSELLRNPPKKIPINPPSPQGMHCTWGDRS